MQRQAGELTDNEEQQLKGAAKQAKGKIQNTAGKVKDAARDTARDIESKNEHMEPQEPCGLRFRGFCAKFGAVVSNLMPQSTLV